MAGEEIGWAGGVLKEYAVRIIPTTYNGIKYRSRTEARWAVVFDQLEWRYHYEIETFSLPSGLYLPDFYLPEFDKFFEVKGRSPTNREQIIAEELCQCSGRDVLIAVGPPDPNRDESDEDIWSYIYWELDDVPQVDFQKGGFVSGRRDNHPQCSLHLGNLDYMGANCKIEWRTAFRAAANNRFGIFG